MKASSSKFCPRCGEYWFPLADYFPRAFHTPKCRRCDVPVEPTGLALVEPAFFAPLILGSFFAMTPYSSNSACESLVAVSIGLLWLLPIIQGVRQKVARKRFQRLLGQQSPCRTGTPPTPEG